LPTSLGRWQFNGNLSLNNMLGLGDQMYLSAGSQVDMARYGFPTATLGMLGGGLTVPLGDAGVTLTGEVLTSRTQPNPVPGAPPSLGNFTRELGRLRIPVIHTRAQTLSLSSSYEIVTQVERLPAFYVQISRDHYAAWRLNASWQRDFGRIPLSVEATV
jgi:hemolysin activation/secretion protein